jgi:hypothetical protein
MREISMGSVNCDNINPSFDSPSGSLSVSFDRFQDFLFSHFDGSRIVLVPRFRRWTLNVLGIAPELFRNYLKAKPRGANTALAASMLELDGGFLRLRVYQINHSFQRSNLAVRI